MAVKTKAELKTQAGNVFVGGLANISAADVKALIIDIIDSLFGNSGGSITVTGSLADDGNGSIELDNDQAAPGNDKYYGTDGTGTRGYFDLPAEGQDVTGINSIRDNGSGTVDLMGDATNPGNDKYYGTDGAGAKGFHDVPIATGADSISGTSTLSLVGDVGNPGNAKYYGTGGSGLKGFHDLPSPGQDVNGLNSITDDGAGNVQFVNDSATPGNDKYYGTDAAGAKGFHDLPAGGDRFVWDIIPLQPSTFSAGGASGHQRFLEANNFNYNLWGVPDGTEIHQVTVILHDTPSAIASINLHWGDATDKIFTNDLELVVGNTFYQLSGSDFDSTMTEVPSATAPDPGSGQTSPINYPAFRRLEMVNITAIDEVAGTIKIVWKLP